MTHKVYKNKKKYQDNKKQNNFKRFKKEAYNDVDINFDDYSDIINYKNRSEIC